MSDINITPFVDVMLVLLVIFLVSTPVLMSQIQVSLPKSTKSAAVQKTEPVILTLTAQNKIYFKDILINSDQELSDALVQIAKTELIYIRGDKDVPYGQMINLMNVIRKQDFQVSLITEDE